MKLYIIINLFLDLEFVNLTLLMEKINVTFKSMKKIYLKD